MTRSGHTWTTGQPSWACPALTQWSAYRSRQAPEPGRYTIPEVVAVARPGCPVSPETAGQSRRLPPSKATWDRPTSQGGKLIMTAEAKDTSFVDREQRVLLRVEEAAKRLRI